MRRIKPGEFFQHYRQGRPTGTSSLGDPRYVGPDQCPECWGYGQKLYGDEISGKPWNTGVTSLGCGGCNNTGKTGIREQAPPDQQAPGPQTPQTPIHSGSDIGGHLAALGLQPGARPDEIRSAYKRASFVHHPDRNPNHPEAAEEFKRINHAYQFLTGKVNKSEVEHIDPKSGKVVIKPCRCKNYPFPHRPASGRCDCKNQSCGYDCKAKEQ